MCKTQKLNGVGLQSEFRLHAQAFSQLETFIFTGELRTQWLLTDLWFVPSREFHPSDKKQKKIYFYIYTPENFIRDMLVALLEQQQRDTIPHGFIFWSIRIM